MNTLKFSDLKCSTCTVMVYSTINFNLNKLFKRLYITYIDLPLTKKQKNVDKKKLSAPYGSIISLQLRNKIRGADLRKKKRKWCTMCRPKTNDHKLILTVSDVLVPYKRDIYTITHHCSSCNETYAVKLEHFLNQLTIIMSIGKNPPLHIMMFKNKLKIAGCKSVEDAMEAIILLWQNYLVPLSNFKKRILYSPKKEIVLNVIENPKHISIKKPNELWGIRKGYDSPEFAFEIVMKNVDFTLGFNIDRYNLREVMNRKEYSEHVHQSIYEPTGHTNVNTKIYMEEPKNLQYAHLRFSAETVERFDETFIPFKSKTKKKVKYNTFIAFGSSKIILSGRYDSDMERAFNIFLSIIQENIDSIRLTFKKIDENKIRNIISRIKKIK